MEINKYYRMKCKQKMKTQNEQNKYLISRRSMERIGLVECFYVMLEWSMIRIKEKHEWECYSYI